MADLTAETAIETVTRKFRAVHKAIETAQDEALELHAAFLKAGRLLGIHPNKSATAGGYLADIVGELADAQQSAALGHALAKEIADGIGGITPMSGGNGKGWP